MTAEAPARQTANRASGALEQAGRKAAARCRAVHPAAWALTAAIALWILTFSVLVVQRQNRFWSVDFDMGIYDQAVWLLAHGRQFITVRGLPVFGHHGTFSLLLFAPAVWLGAGANFLNVFQVVALALAAVPVYLLARERALNPWAGAALGAAVLLHPALQFLSWELFHPETIALTPLLAAYLCSVRRSWRWFAFWIVLAISCKEDIALAVIVIGLVIALRPSRRPGELRIGLFTVGAAALWFVLVTQVMLPLVSGHPAHYEGLYQGVGGSPGGIVETAFRDPGNITGRLTSSESGDFAWRLLAPFGLTGLLSPGVLLIGAPQFVLDVLSDASWTRQITYHYAALPLLGVTVAMVEGVAWLVRRIGGIARWLLPTLVLACALATTIAWGPSPIGAEYDQGWWPPATDSRLDAKEAAVAAIPDGASVSAGYTIVPHLSERDEIYTFPNPWRAANWGYRDEDTRDPRTVDWIAVDRQAVGLEDRALLDSILANGNFEVVFNRDDVLVAHRVRG